MSSHSNPDTRSGSPKAEARPFACDFKAEAKKNVRPGVKGQKRFPKETIPFPVAAGYVDYAASSGAKVDPKYYAMCLRVVRQHYEAPQYNHATNVAKPASDEDKAAKNVAAYEEQKAEKPVKDNHAHKKARKPKPTKEQRLAKREVKETIKMIPRSCPHPKCFTGRKSDKGFYIESKEKSVAFDYNFKKWEFHDDDDEYYISPLRIQTNPRRTATFKVIANDLERLLGLCNNYQCYFTTKYAPRDDVDKEVKRLLAKIPEAKVKDDEYVCLLCGKHVSFIDARLHKCIHSVSVAGTIWEKVDSSYVEIQDAPLAKLHPQEKDVTTFSSYMRALLTSNVWFKCMKCTKYVPTYAAVEHLTKCWDFKHFQEVHLQNNGTKAEMIDQVMAINKALSDIGLPSQVIYDGISPKQETHNGMSLPPYSLIGSLHNSGIEVDAPGLNPNEMYRENYPPGIYTHVSDTVLLKQWISCIARRMNKAEPDYEAAWEWYNRRSNPTPNTVKLLAFDFSSEYQDDYNPDRDFTYLPKVLFDIMCDESYKGDAKIDLKFNDKVIGTAEIHATTPLEVYVKYDGNKRVYHDTYTLKYVEKLRKQRRIDIDSYSFFVPQQLLTTRFKVTSMPMPVLGGLTSECFDFPPETDFIDDMTGIRYHLDGTAQTMCYYASIDKVMSRVPGYNGQVLQQHIANCLNTLGVNLRSYLQYNPVNGNTNLLRTNQPLQQNQVDITEVLPPDLDWKVFIHLLDYLSRQYLNITFNLNIVTINEEEVDHKKYGDQLAGKYIFGPGRHHNVMLVVLRDGRTIGQPGVRERGHVYAGYPIDQRLDNPYNIYLLSEDEMASLMSNFHRMKGDNVGQFGISNYLLHDPYTLDIVNRGINKTHRFKYYLDSHTNFVSIPRDVAEMMQWVKPGWRAAYALSLDRVFPQNYFNTEGDFLSQQAVSADYFRALLYYDVPGVDVVNIRVKDNKLIGKVKQLRQHDVKETLGGKVSNWLYNIFTSDKVNDQMYITPRFDTEFVGLPVSQHIIDTYNKIKVGQRPLQAFFRDLITHFKSNDYGYSCAIVLTTLLYLTALPGGDMLDLDTSVCGIANCVNIPREMKQVANIGVNPVKLDSYGTNEHDSEFEVIFPPPSYLLFKAFFIYYNNACQAVKDSACFSRTILGRPTQIVNIDVVYYAFLKFYASFIPYVEAAHYLTHKELCEDHPRGKIYEPAIEDFFKLCEQICSGFVKVEPYPMKDNGEGGASAPPRGIINPGPAATAFGLTFTHVIEKYMKQHPDFSKGKNFVEVAADLKAHWDSLVNPVCIGCDFTQFENGVSTAVLIASMAIYVYLTGMPVEYIQNWIHRVIYFAQSWLIIEWGKRISGEYQTSIGNMLIVGAILYTVCEKVGNKCTFYSAGDDCLIFCELEDLDKAKDAILEVVRDFGMLIKVEDIYYDFDTIHFCQQYPVLTEEGWVMLNSIDRVLDKLAVQHNIVTDSKRSLNRLGCLGCYLDFLYGSLAFMRPLIDTLLSYKPYKEYSYSRAFSRSRDYHILEALQLSNNFTTKFHIVDYKRMLNVMGFPLSLCDFYFNYFQHWTPFDYIDHKVSAEYLVEGDKIVFQIGDFALYNIVPKFHDTDLDHPRLVPEHPSLNIVTADWFDKLVYSASRAM